MSAARFIAGDWGTSKLHLFLCDANGAAIDSAIGPGAADTRGRFAEVLTTLTEPWRANGTLPIILCGMVGSTIGWVEAPYIACPAHLEDIATASVALDDARVHIIPGLKCRNLHGAPDFMRGEETQILGALELSPELARGRRLLCLPGTHTKWVALRDGAIHDFVSATTGELFALLRDHSVLVRNGSGATAEDTRWFDRGIAGHDEFPNTPLVHRLFECRARQLSGELSAPAAQDFLSGLLIAGDVRGGLNLAHGADTAAGGKSAVCLIGAPQLTSRYARALAAHGRAAHLIDGDAAALAGLTLVHHHLSRRASA